MQEKVSEIANSLEEASQINSSSSSLLIWLNDSSHSKCTLIISMTTWFFIWLLFLSTYEWGSEIGDEEDEDKSTSFTKNDSRSGNMILWGGSKQKEKMNVTG